MIAVFWGDIALDDDDLKLFHIDKAEDWTKPSMEKMGHDTGKYWPLICLGPSGLLEGSIRNL